MRIPANNASCLFVVAALTLVCILPDSAMADSMRCGDSIISAGDSKAKTILRCGNPFYQEKVEVQSAQQSRTKGQIQKRDKYTSDFTADTFSTSSSVGIEKWYYKLGEGQFMRIITFNGDTIIKIEEGDK